MSDTDKTDETNIKSKVPGEQEVRGVNASETANAAQLEEENETDYHYEPVITVTKQEASFTKGDLKLQRISVTEDISDGTKKETRINDVQITTDKDGTREVTHTQTIETLKKVENYSTPLPLQPENPQADNKKPQTKIPILKLRRAIRKIAEDRMKNEDSERNKMSTQRRKSSIPRKKETKHTVVTTITNKEETKSVSPRTDEEFDKLFEEIVVNQSADSSPLIKDPEKLESKFEEIIHDYDENKIEPIDIERIRSKIPLLKRKSEHEIDVSKYMERRGSFKKRGSIDSSINKSLTMHVKDAKTQSQAVERITSQRVVKQNSEKTSSKTIMKSSQESRKHATLSRTIKETKNFAKKEIRLSEEDITAESKKIMLNEQVTNRDENFEASNEYVSKHLDTRRLLKKSSSIDNSDNTIHVTARAKHAETNSQSNHKTVRRTVSEQHASHITSKNVCSKSSQWQEIFPTKSSNNNDGILTKIEMSLSTETITSETQKALNSSDDTGNNTESAIVNSTQSDENKAGTLTSNILVKNYIESQKEPKQIHITGKDLKINQSQGNAIAIPKINMILKDDEELQGKNYHSDTLELENAATLIETNNIEENIEVTREHVHVDKTDKVTKQNNITSNENSINVNKNEQSSDRLNINRASVITNINIGTSDDNKISSSETSIEVSKEEIKTKNNKSDTSEDKNSITAENSHINKDEEKSRDLVSVNLIEGATVTSHLCTNEVSSIESQNIDNYEQISNLNNNNTASLDEDIKIEPSKDHEISEMKIDSNFTKKKLYQQSDTSEEKQFISNVNNNITEITTEIKIATNINEKTDQQLDFSEVRESIPNKNLKIIQITKVPDSVNIVEEVTIEQNLNSNENDRIENDVQSSNRNSNKLLKVEKSEDDKINVSPINIIKNEKEQIRNHNDQLENDRNINDSGNTENSNINNNNQCNNKDSKQNIAKSENIVDEILQDQENITKTLTIMPGNSSATSTEVESFESKWNIGDKTADTNSEKNTTQEATVIKENLIGKVKQTFVASHINTSSLLNTSAENRKSVVREERQKLNDQKVEINEKNNTTPTENNSDSRINITKSISTSSESSFTNTDSVIQKETVTNDDILEIITTSTTQSILEKKVTESHTVTTNVNKILKKTNDDALNDLKIINKEFKAFENFDTKKEGSTIIDKMVSKPTATPVIDISPSFIAGQEKEIVISNNNLTTEDIKVENNFNKKSQPDTANTNICSKSEVSYNKQEMDGKLFLDKSMINELLNSDLQEEDIIILKGKVNRVMSRLDSKITKKNNVQQEIADEVPKRTVLSKIAIFERKEVDESPLQRKVQRSHSHGPSIRHKPKIVEEVLKNTVKMEANNNFNKVDVSTKTNTYTVTRHSIDKQKSTSDMVEDNKVTISNEEGLEGTDFEKSADIANDAKTEISEETEFSSLKSVKFDKICDRKSLKTTKKESRKEKEITRELSYAEVDLGDVVRGKVKQMVVRMISMERMDLEKKGIIDIKEKPKHGSVLEKIALFEKKVTPAKAESKDKPIAQTKPVTEDNMSEEELQQKIEELIGAKKKYGRFTDLKYVELSDGTKMPAIGLGTALLKKNLTKYIVAAAIDLGYRTIDTAYIYGNEKEIGEAINEKIRDGTVQREDLFVISKLWSTFHRKDLVQKACKLSLKTMGLDYFDMYMIHNPMSFMESDDPLPKIANVIQYSESDYLDAWYGVEHVVRKGLARRGGVSNFNSAQVDRIIDKGKIKPLINQVECHPYLTQHRLDEFCQSRDVKLNCYGILGSKGTPLELKSGLTPVIDDPLVLVMAAGLNITPAQLLISYQLHLDHSVVVKSSSGAHLWSNLQAQAVRLESSHIEALNALNRNKRNFTFKGMGDTHRNYPFRIPY